MRELHRRFVRKSWHEYVFVCAVATAGRKEGRTAGRCTTAYRGCKLQAGHCKCGTQLACHNPFPYKSKHECTLDKQGLLANTSHAAFAFSAQMRVSAVRVPFTICIQILLTRSYKTVSACRCISVQAPCLLAHY